MELKPIGSYFTLDEDGYICNSASLEKVPPKWRVALEDVKNAYIAAYGDSLVSVYVRGSVPQGTSIEGVSDIDTFALVSLQGAEIDASWMEPFREKMRQKYPFIQGTELSAILIDELPKRKGTRIMIKTQSALLYGRDVAGDLPPLMPGKESSQHMVGLAHDIENTLIWLSEPHTETEIQGKCAWIMKRIVRAGFELVMLRVKRYTRDLYLCWETFSEYYPEKSGEMHGALELAVYPTSEAEIINTILNDLGAWLVEEIRTSK